MSNKLNPNQLTFYHPAKYTENLEQLKSRTESGLRPILIAKEPFTEKEEDKLIEFLSDNKITGVPFDIQLHGALDNEELYSYYNKQIASLTRLFEKEPSIFSGIVSTKLNPTMKHYYYGDPLRSMLSLDDVIDSLKNNYKNMETLIDIADENGLKMVIENKPAINYSYLPHEQSSFADPYPRWNRQWSARPVYIGDHFINSREMIYFLSRLDDCHMELDIEHLAQTIQWGNIFNLENATNGILKFGDLTGEQKASIYSYGLGYLRDNDVLFDYANLLRDEQASLDELGFIVRKEKPLIFKKRLTLESELKALSFEDVKIASITPGFQVYQGIQLAPGSIIIGSHMPGIVERYIPDRELRDKLKKDIGALHSLVWDFINYRNITDINLEIQVDDGSKIIYHGPEWGRQATEARRQLLDNFKKADEKKSNLKDGPYYLI